MKALASKLKKILGERQHHNDRQADLFCTSCFGCRPVYGLNETSRAAGPQAIIISLDLVL